MAEAKDVSDYRQTLLDANTSQTTHAQTPINYFSVLSIRTGAIVGFFGSIAIIVVITLLAGLASVDIWLAPRFIASVFLGDAAWSGAFPIAVGTLIHLTLGVIYGAIFALALPRLPRAFWFVAGIIYGVMLWGIAAFLLPNLTQSSMMNGLAYTNALIISHITFGIVLGVAGSFFGTIESE